MSIKRGQKTFSIFSKTKLSLFTGSFPAGKNGIAREKCLQSCRLISAVARFERDKISLRSNKMKPKARGESCWSLDEKWVVISDMMTHIGDSPGYLTFLLVWWWPDSFVSTFYIYQRIQQETFKTFKYHQNLIKDDFNIYHSSLGEKTWLITRIRLPSADHYNLKYYSVEFKIFKILNDS